MGNFVLGVWLRPICCFFLREEEDKLCFHSLVFCDLKFLGFYLGVGNLNLNRGGEAERSFFRWQGCQGNFWIVGKFFLSAGKKISYVGGVKINY